MVAIIITLVVVLMVVVLAFYILRAFPLPAPLGKFVEVAVVVVACLVVIMLLLSWGGVVSVPMK